MKDEHVRDEPVKDAAQDVPQEVVQELAFGARAPRVFLASPLATTAAAAVFVQLTPR